MKIIRTFWSLFLYAGVDRETYYQLKPTIRRENGTLLRVFSPIACVMFSLLILASRNASGLFSENTSTYLICALAMLVLCLLSSFLLPKHPGLTTSFVYVFEIVLYLFAARISLLHADKPAVTAIAFLLVSPLLFYDRPVRLSALNAAAVAFFCVLISRYKPLEIARTDIWNLITFCVVACTVMIFIMKIKIRAILQSRQIEYLSQTDLLTGAKNRNHYENRLSEYPGRCVQNLLCVYADVNGLHEMNNREGHAAGDRMLQEVASVIRRHFGPDDTYRIGGDEFVAFRPNGHPETLSGEIAQIGQELGEKGYHVSFGSAIYESSSAERLEMHQFVRKAENEMYEAKRAFYRGRETQRGSR